MHHIGRTPGLDIMDYDAGALPGEEDDDDDEDSSDSDDGDEDAPNPYHIVSLMEALGGVSSNFGEEDIAEYTQIAEMGGGAGDD